MDMIALLLQHRISISDKLQLVEHLSHLAHSDSSVLARMKKTYGRLQ
jgi:hypothetical protein